MFIYEAPFLDLEIYRLLTILEASPALAEFEGDEYDQRIVEFLRNFERPEVSRIVVSLAAIVRSSLDATPATETEKIISERPVGVWWPDERSPQIVPLEFREACNKVLHADRVAPEPPAPLKELVLYGSHRKKNWKALLDLRAFALTAARLTP